MTTREELHVNTVYTSKYCSGNTLPHTRSDGWPRRHYPSSRYHHLGPLHIVAPPFPHTLALPFRLHTLNHARHATHPPRLHIRHTQHSPRSTSSPRILIHAGDLTQSGTDRELDHALAWLNASPHPYKLFIAGNHDVALVSPETRARISPGLTYLENSSVELTIRGRKLLIYGSPYTPKHGSWPFQYPRIHPSPAAHPPPKAHETWSHIPPLTDVLITHGPPFAHLDADRFGCYGLLSALWQVRPRLHVFGHVHAGRGVEHIKWDQGQMAYEDVCAGHAGWGGILKLLWYKLTARLWKRFLGDDIGTLLVNAAAVSGLRDDQIKGPIVVEI